MRRDDDKQAAYDFLKELQAVLNKGLPNPLTLRAEVAKIWDKPKLEKKPQEQLACKENIFLYHFALPHIFAKVRQTLDDSVGNAQLSLRGEYYQKFPAFMSANALRRSGHPFSKTIGASIRETMDAWKKPRTSYPLYQAYPDLALSKPFPFGIIFDAKFFESESPNAADEALVQGIYEVAFYRGLPVCLDWSYEFGCLLAYDATDGANLQRAWDSISSKSLFWDDANVFVMVLRGTH